MGVNRKPKFAFSRRRKSGGTSLYTKRSSKVTDTQN